MHPLILAGFTAMRGLAVEDEDPPRASRPFDATRAGFVMGEGACVLVLEDLDAAQARGARVYAEVLGYGGSNDAHHMAQPEPEATGRRGHDARRAAARERRSRARRLHQCARDVDAARHAVDPDGRRQRADEPERDADPLHGLWPEARHDVQGEPNQADRPVAEAGIATARGASTSSTEAPEESTSAFVNFCRPIDPIIGSIAARR